MKIKLRKSIVTAPVLIAASLLSGCMIQLAPSYDQSTVGQLNEVNANALALFAALEQGVRADEHQKYDAQFSQIIGSYRSLRMQASTRPIPAAGQAIVEKIKSVNGVEGLISEICKKASDCVYATPKIIDTIVDALVNVQATVKSEGYAPAPATGTCASGKVTGVKPTENAGVLPEECAYQHAVSLALIAESSLKR
ncbi:hypothetical protein [Burkholderia perseverans]|uniref:hypothetical protein n=1 Tax=Burkholderia perseverans TaxID=2615214 RepID=UPI001FED86AB|nr:hypothetical protein [Burkholderia perseverans]